MKSSEITVIKDQYDGQIMTIWKLVEKCTNAQKALEKILPVLMEHAQSLNLGLDACGKNEEYNIELMRNAVKKFDKDKRARLKKEKVNIE